MRDLYTERRNNLRLNYTFVVDFLLGKKNEPLSDAEYVKCLTLIQETMNYADEKECDRENSASNASMMHAQEMAFSDVAQTSDVVQKESKCAAHADMEVMESIKSQAKEMGVLPRDSISEAVCKRQEWASSSQQINKESAGIENNNKQNLEASYKKETKPKSKADLFILEAMKKIDRGNVQQPVHTEKVPSFSQSLPNYSFEGAVTEDAQKSTNYVPPASTDSLPQFLF